MVKHLHFNPTNFNQLILSGLLIEIYKDDIELHPSHQTHHLEFIQGQNVVENTLQGILRFANADSKKKYFGLNRQQEAVISMVNGVCKDIDAKLQSTASPEDLTEKITYLNEFWASPSSEWLKQKFYYCHMNILTLSFRVQQKFPDLLIKFPVFVQLRRLFISDKWLSKKALVSMFANPSNIYQEFDLFPEAEEECSLRSSFGIPAESGEEDAEIQQIEHNFVEIQAVEIADGDEMQGRHSYHLKQKIKEKKLESQIQITTTPTEPQRTEQAQTDSRISEGFRDIDSETSKIKTTQPHFTDIEEDRFQILEAESHIKTKHTEQLSQQQEKRRSHENQAFDVAGSEVRNEVSAVVGEMVSDVKSGDLDNTRVDDISRVEQAINQSEANQRNLEKSDNSGSNKMKKSLKESFSQHFTRPLEYSTRSLAEEDQVIKHEEKTQEKHEQKATQHVKQQKHQHHEEKYDQVKKDHQNPPKQQKTETKPHASQQKMQQPTIQLQKQVIIDEAESQKYVSQQHVQPSQPKATVSQQQQKPVQPSPIQTSPQVQQTSKAPQSQSVASASHKGPRTDMQQSIKPKEQPVQKQKETCKCEIY